MRDGRSTVLVYRDRLFFASERFILNQGEALAAHSPHYVGVRAEPAVAPPADRTTLLRQGSRADLAREVAFKLFGRVPASFARLGALAPVVLHAHFGPDGVRAIPIARRLGIPLITTFHGFDATVSDDGLRAAAALSMRRYPANRRALAAFGSRFVAVSRFIADKIVNQGFPADRVVVHYIGVDVARFSPSVAIQRESLILFVGRLTPKKGVDDFLLAVAAVQSRQPAINAVIVGDGPDRARLEARAASLRVRVTFAGFQDPTTVLAWLRRSMVLCAPSKTAPNGDAEGFGLVFAEAQAAGLPVVSYASGGVVEAVAHGETGYLVPEGDWLALAQSIERLIGDGSLWKRFSEAGIARVRRLFDISSQSRALDDIYADVASRWAHGERNVQRGR